MKAVRFHRFGGPEVLAYEDGVPRPSIGPGQVLIKVAGAGVNFTDLNRRGGANPGIELPAGVGVEGAGTIEEVGPDVSGFQVGDRVMGQGFASVSGQAEYVAAETGRVFPCPDDLDLVEAGGTPNNFLTAYHVVKTRAQVQPGQTVLVHAAASGMGTVALQLAKICGARVIATGSTEEKLDLARSIGADEVVNYANADFEEEVKGLTEGQGVDVVLEALGGEVLEKSLSCLAPLGRLVTYGNISGKAVSFHTANFFRSNQSILGLGMGIAPRGGLDLRGAMAEMVPLIQAGKLRLVVDRIVPMSDVGNVHAHLAGRGAMGKVILTP